MMPDWMLGFSPRCSVSTMRPNTVSTMISARSFVRPATSATSSTSAAFVRLLAVMAAGVSGIDWQGMMSHHRMDDAAYKRLFSRPRMVRDLLLGFAARDWSGALDLASLMPLPASYVSRNLRQRHGDLVWRVRFGGERWLYLVLLLEFQSGVDRAMAVRMLTYSGLLYQRLVAEGVLRERGALPPVLPVVI